MPDATLALDPDFLHQYEQERLRWLRIRFLWFAGSLGVMWGLGAAALLAVILSGVERPENVGVAVLAAAVLKAALFLVPFGRVLRAPAPLARERLLRLVFWMILGYSLIQFLAAVPAAMAINTVARELGSQMKLGLGVPIFLQTLLIHLLASLLIPWTPREAIRPLVPFLSVYFLAMVVAVLVGDSDLTVTGYALIAMLIIPAPGLAVCALRQSRFVRRFTDRAVRARYGELRHELDTARRIHDRLFPAPIAAGAVRLEYVYEPMRQIGGDFLFVGADPATGGPPAGGPLSVLLIDVTGHGIAAALAVNRLHGELARIFGSEADASPGRVLAELNRYIHLTMSRDTVFATALCLRVDPVAGEVRWASAGHPPALHFAAAGAMSRLEATTFLLGAAHPEEFDASERAVPFGPGDSVLAYTDGAIEARLAGGGMIGMEGLEGIAGASRARAERGVEAGWCGEVLARVKEARDGPAEDDTLVVRVWRPAR